ncbi:MAG: 3-phosphoshikimate 1-carboxyvinyltransferase [Planctomycetota bacterium]|jgi:3-phosphoshikimate 1-carboxyvinyltransferase
MILRVNKTKLSGIVEIPGSKSHNIRAIAVAALANGTSYVRNPLLSNDTLSAVDGYRALGAKIDTSQNDVWTVEGTGRNITPSNDVIDIGNSGTTLRLAAGSAALAPNGTKTKFTGDHQIQARPISPLLSALNDLGAKAASLKDNGCAPIIIEGTLKGGRTTIECVTSQYLSSLLMACPLAEGDSTIDITLLNEPDYVQITLDWLDRQQIKYENDNWKSFHIPGGQSYKPFDAAIPADFSSATFFLCAAAICGEEVLIKRLDFDDSQPDKAVVDYLKAMGADIKQAENGVKVSKTDLKGIEIDMNRTPDALPAMAVTAAFAEGTTKLVNVPQARNKETDRIACMANELSKLGAGVEELPDGLIIHGRAGENLTAAPVCGHHDHRIVMAMSIAGMAMDQELTIDTAEAMNVTFPEYVTLMNNLGANLTMTQ